MRILPHKPMLLEQGNFPNELKNVVNLANGLVVICGPRGGGTSTAIRAMLVERGQGAVLSIEDLVEIPFRSNTALISQQEVGVDGLSLTALMSYATEERFDVISCTFEPSIKFLNTCLEAAISCLVLLEMKSLNQLDALYRFEDAFGGLTPEKKKILSKVSRSLIHIQPLEYNGGQRKPLVGIININETCRDLIAEGSYEELIPMTKLGKAGQGSQCIDTVLSKLVRDENIKIEEALDKAINPSAMRLRVKGIIHTD